MEVQQITQEFENAHANYINACTKVENIVELNTTIAELRGSLNSTEGQTKAHLMENNDLKVRLYNLDTTKQDNQENTRSRKYSDITNEDYSEEDDLLYIGTKQGNGSTQTKENKDRGKKWPV